ncbi:PD-(D/E)XK nuclease family protein [Bifidobacterium magnum]|uniref:PD-(D/E)XK nuclease family protein n=1 Tax=Bifidobacterium magnum TaxID=1692 RepID=UPI000AD60EF2|nr:PD-(D/E)XK nuclease family protein [Bifidobacterium magnum]
MTESGINELLTDILDAAPAQRGAAGNTVLITGAPASGKSEAAFRALVACVKRFGESNVVMTVANRQLADQYSDRLIRELGSVSQARPVTTLNAVAFRMLSDYGNLAGKKPPRLLNGAEQDALIRQVLAVHVQHAMTGDLCATCELLREYFATDTWAGIVREQDDSGLTGETVQLSATTETLLTQGMNEAFVMQLRDMIARMNELDATNPYEYLEATENAGLRGERLRIQWKLAFALRKEYDERIAVTYPDEYRLDSSRLLASAAHVVDRVPHLPNALVVDDVQDVTLSGFMLLRTLHHAGVQIVCTGNADESVQTFRGSYPEYVLNHVVGELGAKVVEVAPKSAAQSDGGQAVGDGASMLETVESRVSLSITSPEETVDAAIPKRAGKLPVVPGSWPIETLAADDARRGDGSVRTSQFKSAREELDTVVWQIKTQHLAGPEALRDWNAMAVIMHDNDAIRALGERLRADGVPVRYSSVTKPLKDEPFVQGLFSLIELAQLRNAPHESRDPRELAGYVRKRVEQLAASPLVAANARPLQLHAIDAAMDALGSLAQVLERPGEPRVLPQEPEAEQEAPEAPDARPQESAEHADDPDAPQAAATLPAIIEQWNTLQAALLRDQPQDGPVIIDMSGAHDPASRSLPFGRDAMLILLACSGGTDILDAVNAVYGADAAEDNPQMRAFVHLWSLVDELAARLRALRAPQPQFALMDAWEVCAVAEDWQTQALLNTQAGRDANDRLDTAMRLFEYAQGADQSGTITTFIDHVRQLQIEADSLAKTAPIDSAVTLTTPAGAAGRHWPVVWLPGVQQGVWPNLVPRNTMFGGEDLVDVQLYGTLDEQREAQRGVSDLKLREVLAGEQKSFLVALTRAEADVRVSAVINDEEAPSDFLYTYLPEWYNRARDGEPETRVYWTDNAVPETAQAQPDSNGNSELDAVLADTTLNADMRGLVALAREIITTRDPGAPEYEDALDTLALLADHGVAAADPSTWQFMPAVPSDVANANDASAAPSGTDAPPVTAIPAAASHQSLHVTLSPSNVDSIWGCPVCWLMESRFAGPQVSKVSMAFGSIIHEVAEYGAREHFDDPQFLADEPDLTKRITAIYELLLAHYETQRLDPEQIEDPEEQFQALRRDAQARTMLLNIAWYFVMSNEPAYLANNHDKFEVGTLESSDPERQFSASFTLHDILDAYNAIPSLHTPVTADELVALMRFTLGEAGGEGWPDGYDPKLSVHLSGRMDRLERRVTASGAQTVRLIDYKTGASFSTERQFNDLQLVCYQLGLAFSDATPLRGSAAIRRMPNIAQSDLFFVRDYDAPASYYSQPEGVFQPPLFDPATGSLNSATPVDRYYLKDPVNRLFYKKTGLDFTARPEGVREEVWNEFTGLRATLAIWSLAMIARVYYAACAVRSTDILAYPQPYHMSRCRLHDLCPACARAIATVYETKEL